MNGIFHFSRQTSGPKRGYFRSLSTLVNHSHIYVFPRKSHSEDSILSLLPTEPPLTELAIGTTSKLPPSPDSFEENPKFLKILQLVLGEHAHEDPEAISQAQVMASTSGANLGSGGVFFAPRHKRASKFGAAAAGRGDSSKGVSGQGGTGSGRGGWIHVSDARRPPEFGRIAWPEDIFGSLEADNNGDFVGRNGNYQPSGTYRIVTRDGILGLSPFLREKLADELRKQERLARMS